jgi:multidrug efflux pump subunit AcrA (membrane-fusion protein)
LNFIGSKKMSRSYEDIVAAGHRRQAELDTQQRAEQAERDRLNAETRARREADIESQRVAESDRRAREDAARRDAENERLCLTLRGQFFSNNPAASEADFDRLFPAMRDEHFRQQMAEAEAAMRAGIANVI